MDIENYWQLEDIQVNCIIFMVYFGSSDGAGGYIMVLSLNKKMIKQVLDCFFLSNYQLVKRNKYLLHTKHRQLNAHGEKNKLFDCFDIYYTDQARTKAKLRIRKIFGSDIQMNSYIDDFCWYNRQQYEIFYNVAKSSELYQDASVIFCNYKRVLSEGARLWNNLGMYTPNDNASQADVIHDRMSGRNNVYDALNNFDIDFTSNFYTFCFKSDIQHQEMPNVNVVHSIPVQNLNIRNDDLRRRLGLQQQRRNYNVDLLISEIEDISELYNIDLNESLDNCVINAMRKNRIEICGYKSLIKLLQSELQDNKKICFKQLCDILDTQEIKIRVKIYNVGMYVIYEKMSNTHNKILNLLINNHHMYIIKGDHKDVKKFINNNLDGKTIKIHENKIDGIMSGSQVVTLDSNEILIYDNKLLHTTKNSSFHIMWLLREQLIKTVMSLKTDYKQLCEQQTLYNFNKFFYACSIGLGIKIQYSFFPVFKNINVVRDIQFASEQQNLGNVYCIDKNLAFTYALFQIEYYARIDILVHRIIENIDEINEIVENLQQNYIILIEYTTSYGLRQITWFTSFQYQQLAQIKTVQITQVIQLIQCEFVRNTYRDVLEIFYDILQQNEQYCQQMRQQFKMLLNKFYGNLLRVKNYDDVQKDTIEKYHIIRKDDNCLYNEEDKSITILQCDLISDDFYMCKQTEQRKKKKNKSYIYNDNYALGNQIKSQNILNILRKCDKIIQNNGQIVQIKTDAIFYSSDDDILSKIINIDEQDDVMKWKVQKISDNWRIKTAINDCSMVVNDQNQRIQIINQYGGQGKTQNIMNILKDDKIGETMVVCPYHQQIQEYRRVQEINDNKDRVQIMEKIKLTKEIPQKIKTIYIDEAYLCNTEYYYFYIQLCILSKNIQIYAYGDNKQLRPVKHFQIQNYDMFFSEQESIFFEGRRNDFTEDYLYQIATTDDYEYLFQQVKKYRYEFTTQDITIERLEEMVQNNVYHIFYTNQKRKDLENQYVKKYQHMQYQQLFDRKIIKSNEYTHLDIYNNHLFYGINQHQEIKKKDIEQYYFLTLHSIQGKGCQYYIDDDEIKNMIKIDFYNKQKGDTYNRFIYTLISRYKKNVEII